MFDNQFVYHIAVNLIKHPLSKTDFKLDRNSAKHPLEQDNGWTSFSRKCDKKTDGIMSVLLLDECCHAMSGISNQSPR